MASAFRSVASAASWRHHEVLSDLEASPVPDRFRQKTSAAGLNAMRMSLRKRIPLKDVEMNFDENPTWECLEAKEKRQNLRALKRKARNVFGTVSQKIQDTCQGPARSLVASLAHIPGSRHHRSARNGGSPLQTPRRRSSRLAMASAPTPGASIVSPSGKRAPVHPGSRWLKTDLVPLRRSMRTAALRSPYCSPLLASQRRQFDCDMEFVSRGIRRLKRLSHAFNEIIAQEERDEAVLNYYQVMAQNMRATRSRSGHRSESLLQRRLERLRRPLCSWADARVKAIF